MAAFKKSFDQGASRRSILAAGSALFAASAADPGSPALAQTANKPSAETDASGVSSRPRYEFATTAALLRAFPASIALGDGAVAETSGRTTPGDGGGARFYYQASDVAAADNSGTLRVDGAGRRWHAVNVDRANVRVFGAKGDGATDDSEAFTAALAALQTVHVPPGRFLLATPVPINQGNQVVGDGSMRGMNGPEGQQCAILLPRTAAFVTAKPLVQLEDVTIQGLCFEGGTTQLDFGLFHDVAVEDCEFRGFTTAGLCIVRGEKQKLSRLRFDFTVHSKYGLCFGYEASINYADGLYAGHDPTQLFGLPDAWADRILMQQVYFQATAGGGTWTIAAITSRILSGLVANDILFHGSGAGDGKLISSLVRVQYSTFNMILTDSINKTGPATTGFDTPEILNTAIITMVPRFAGNSHYTRTFNFGAAFGLTMIGCAANGDNSTEFGMYFSNAVGQTILLIGCAGAVYSAGAEFVPGQINLVGCDFSTSNLPSHSGQLLDMRNAGFLTTIMADYNGKAAATAAAMWKFARGGGGFSTPFSHRRRGGASWRAALFRHGCRSRLAADYRPIQRGAQWRGDGEPRFALSILYGRLGWRSLCQGNRNRQYGMGQEMRRLAVVQRGIVIHIGAWDPVTRHIDPETKTIVETKNPLPDDAVQGEFDIEEIEGRFILASDYRSRRAAEYPSVPDQLDALWKGGAEMAAMRERIAAIKAKFPKA